MKKFLITLFHGFELTLLGVLSTNCFILSGMMFTIIHKESGWIAILDLCFAVVLLAVGVLFMWILGDIGNEVVEHSKEHKEEENK